MKSFAPETNRWISARSTMRILQCWARSSDLPGATLPISGSGRDTRADVTDRLHQAASQFDVVLTSGGASLGEEDHMSSAIEELGSRHFWQIAVKPGRPLMLSRIDDSIIIGLPGNPVAVLRLLRCFLDLCPAVVTTARRRPLAGTTAIRAAGSLPCHQAQTWQTRVLAGNAGPVGYRARRRKVSARWFGSPIKPSRSRWPDRHFGRPTRRRTRRPGRFHTVQRVRNHHNVKQVASACVQSAPQSQPTATCLKIRVHRAFEFEQYVARLISCDHPCVVRWRCMSRCRLKVRR